MSASGNRRFNGRSPRTELRDKSYRQFADGRVPRKRVVRPVDVGTKILLVATCAIALFTLASCIGSM